LIYINLDKDKNLTQSREVVNNPDLPLTANLYHFHRPVQEPTINTSRSQNCTYAWSISRTQ